jgi:surface carbohydrate biosynthesis protein (TIGR04326 family)
VLLWDGAPGGGRESLGALVEERAEEVRRRYLAWAHDLGEVVVRGRPLRQRFRLGSRSLWGQSLFVEQSMWKQWSLEPLVKVFALESLLERSPPSSLTFAGDRAMHRVLQRVSESRGVRYEWRPIRARAARLRGVRGLPRLIQGLLAVAYFAVARWAWRRPKARPRAATVGASRVLISGPFFDPGGRDPAEPPFVSEFWTTLPALLRECGLTVHWLHYFYAHDRVPSVAAARRAMRRLNAAGAGDEHFLVDGYVTVPIMVRLLPRGVKLAAESIAVG